MLESERYKTSLNEVFSTKRKFELQLLVEKVLAEANYLVGKIPKEAFEIINLKCNTTDVKLERAQEIEKDIHHDLMSVVKAIAEQCGEYGGYIHLGATSYDIQDTVRGLQLKDARNIILETLNETIQITSGLALKYKDLVCIGRTHGQHAIPTTYGMKIGNFLNELILVKELLTNTNVAYGKISGAVGTYASYGTDEIEKIVLKKLDLKKQPLTTQVVSRVIYSKYVYALGLIATVLDHFAREIRNLQRTEIDEIRESFDKAQVGSSTMPQKRNPEKSERISGLARNIRSAVQVSFENVCLEHERDLTNSSSERLVLAETSILTHYILLQMNQVLSSLHFNEEKIKKNLYLRNGAQCSEHLMIRLSDKIGRQKAHELLKQLSNKDNFMQATKDNETVREFFSEDEIDSILEPMNYVGLASKIVEEFVNSLKDEKDEEEIPSSYSEAGVDLKLESKVLKIINEHVKNTFEFGDVVGREGHYANLIKYGDQGLALVTDGVGTKLLIAQKVNKFDTIGIDCVAMNVNDLLAMGIVPKAFVDYLAVAELNADMIEEILKGLYKGCEFASIPLIGGELATVPEMLKGSGKPFDLVGTALGMVHLNKLIDGSKIQVGDVVLGISSSGIHSNGYTLARKVLQSNYQLDDVFDGQKKLSDELLIPTRIYSEVIESLIDNYDVHGLAHITGGGFSKLFRLTENGFLLKHFPMPSKIFEEIQKLGKISYDEMFSTFNMGIGFVVVVPEEEKEKVLYHLNKYFDSHILGQIIEEPTVKIPDYDVQLTR
jgi:adenylosuccinate lyase